MRQRFLFLISTYSPCLCQFSQRISYIFVVAFAQIDWHDFVVVETVNFRESETG